jgi:hypothetical protein
MQNIFFTLLVAVTLFVSCGGNSDCTNVPLIYVDTLKFFKKDVPTLDGLNDLFYDLIKQREQSLNLDSIDSGYAGLQIRIWYDLARPPEKKLLVIRNQDTVWRAKIYMLKENWQGDRSILSVAYSFNVLPLSGWVSFSRYLLNSPITSLPSMHILREYETGKDGIFFNVEIASKNQYRFYNYADPVEHEQQFWEAKKMTEIIQQLEYEFNFSF